MSNCMSPGLKAFWKKIEVLISDHFISYFFPTCEDASHQHIVYYPLLFLLFFMRLRLLLSHVKNLKFPKIYTMHTTACASPPRVIVRWLLPNIHCRIIKQFCTAAYGASDEKLFLNFFYLLMRRRIYWGIFWSFFFGFCKYLFLCQVSISIG